MDHYRTLQIARDAEPEVIEKAYKALCLKYHPDVAAPDQRDAATARMQIINDAYHTLRDPELRRRYDSALPVDRQGRSAWDVFMNKGLVGMFLEKVDFHI